MPQTDFQEAIKAASVVLEMEARSSDEVQTDLRSFDVSDIEAVSPQGPADGSSRAERITEQPTESPTTVQPTGFPTTLPPEIPPPEPDVAKCKPAIQSSTLEGNVARQVCSEQ